jgi:hypothetical protein
MRIAGREWMMQLRDVVVTRIRHMQRLYELSGGVSHDGEKGAFREFFVAELLRPMLPDHFGLGSGIVIDKDGRQSPQVDVIIYDRRLLPPVMLAGDRGIYPIDSVLAVCEVKSCLTATHYTQILNTAGYFRPPAGCASGHPNGLPIATPFRNGASGYWPLFAVFAYTSDAKEKAEPERLKDKISALHDAGIVQLIAVLDKGVWVDLDGGFKEVREENRIGPLFLVHLLNRLEEVARSRGDFRLQDWI